MFRKVALLVASIATLIAANPVIAAPAPTPSRQSSNCANAPAPAAAVGACKLLVNITNFDNVDYGLTFKPGYDLYCYKGFGSSCTNVGASFTGAIASNVLTVSGSAAGNSVVAPWQGLPFGIPLKGAGITFGASHILSQLTYVQTTATQSQSANASHTLTVASCANIHQYMVVFDANAGTPGTPSDNVGYVNGCSGTTLTWTAVGGVNVTNAIAVASGDTLDIGGGNGTYQLDAAPNISSETMTTPTFWENPDRSITMTQDGSRFSATVSTAAQLTGTTFVGKVFRGPLYVDVSAAAASNTDCPASGQWEAFAWFSDIFSDIQNFAGMTPRGVSLGAHNSRYLEDDFPEIFDCLTGYTSGPHVAWWHLHDWYPYDSTFNNIQNPGGSISISTLGSQHLYGTYVGPTNSCGYLDDVLVTGSCATYAPLVTKTGAASGSWTTSNNAIPMATPPSPTVQAGDMAIDVIQNANIGLVAGYGNSNGTLVKLVAAEKYPATNASPLAMVVGAIVPANNLLIVPIISNNSQGGAITVADDVSDSFTLLGHAANPGGATNGEAWLYYTYTTGLTATQHVTITPNVSGDNYMDAEVDTAAGMVAAGADGGSCGTVANNAANATSPSITTTTNADLIVGLAGLKAGTLTQQAGFALPPITTGGSMGAEGLGGNKVQTIAGAITYSPGAAGATQGGVSCIGAFKVTSGGTVQLNLQSNALVNSSGGSDPITFVWAPPITSQTNFNEAAQYDQGGGQNLKMGTGPQNPITLKSVRVYGPAGSDAQVTQH